MSSSRFDLADSDSSQRSAFEERFPNELPASCYTCYSIGLGYCCKDQNASQCTDAGVALAWYAEISTLTRGNLRSIQQRAVQSRQVLLVRDQVPVHALQQRVPGVHALLGRWKEPSCDSAVQSHRSPVLISRNRSLCLGRLMELKEISQCQSMILSCPSTISTVYSLTPPASPSAPGPRSKLAKSFPRPTS